MKKSLIAVVAILLVCTSIGYTQIESDIDQIESYTSLSFYDFDFVGGGTRAKGMGNAFLGVSNDISSGSWNPAGLFEMDETTISISMFKLSPRGESFSNSLTDSVQIGHSGSFNDISSINFISPIRIQGHPFVFTGNLTRNFNSFLQQKSMFDTTQIATTVTFEKVYVDTNLIDVTQNIIQEGGINSLNLGFSTRFYDNISFGATINIYTGSSILRINRVNSTTDFRYNVFQFALASQHISVTDTNKFSGSNFTLGFMRNSEKLDLGLVVRTPFKLREKRIQLINQTSFVQENPASDRSIIEDNGIILTDILFKYEMPLMIGFGVGYQYKENWLLAADVEYRGFSGNKVDYRISQTINPGGSNIEEYVSLDPLWKNSISVRLGSEYTKSFDFGDVPFRAGFGYVPQPNPSIDDLGGTSSVVNYNFTAGTGIHFEQIKLDISYMYSTSDLEIGSAQEIDFKNHTITASFTGVF